MYWNCVIRPGPVLGTIACPYSLLPQAKTDPPFNKPKE